MVIQGLKTNKAKQSEKLAVRRGRSAGPQWDPRCLPPGKTPAVSLTWPSHVPSPPPGWRGRGAPTMNWAFFWPMCCRSQAEPPFSIASVFGAHGPGAPGWSRAPTSQSPAFSLGFVAPRHSDFLLRLFPFRMWMLALGDAACSWISCRGWAQLFWGA